MSDAVANAVRAERERCLSIIRAVDTQMTGWTFEQRQAFKSKAINEGWSLERAAQQLSWARASGAVKRDAR